MMTIVGYGMGNIGSILNMLERVGVEVRICSPVSLSGSERGGWWIGPDRPGAWIVEPVPGEVNREDCVDCRGPTAVREGVGGVPGAE